MTEENEDVKRLKEKMKAQPRLESVEKEELPSMEQDDKTEEAKKAEVDALRKKADNGAAGVVSKIMKQPEVQHVIRVEINKQMFISGLFMAFFLVGFFQLFSVAKVVLGYNWTVDLAIGVVMCIMGAVYTAKQVLQK